MKKSLNKKFEFQGKSKKSYESSAKISYGVMIFGLTSLIAFGVYSIIEFIVSLIK